MEEGINDVWSLAQALARSRDLLLQVRKILTEQVAQFLCFRQCETLGRVQLRRIAGQLPQRQTGGPLRQGLPECLVAVDFS